MRWFWDHWHARYGLALLAIAAAIITTIQINSPDKAPDFTVFHAAALHAFGLVYDPEYLTAQQYAPDGLRPFAYPPTFLLLILPLGLLSFKAAYVVWATLGITAYFAAGLRWTRWIWVALYSPLVLFGTLIGQTSLLVAALVLAAFAPGKRNGTMRGIALGLAAAIKPPLVLLLPVILLARRDWRMMAVSSATLVCVATMATVVFGVHAWADWLNALPRFVDINDARRIERLGLPVAPWGRVLILAVGGLLTYGLARKSATSKALLAALGSAMLASPHTAFYDVVILIPPAIVAATPSWKLLAAVPLVVAKQVAAPLLLICLLVLIVPRGRFR